MQEIFLPKKIARKSAGNFLQILNLQKNPHVNFLRDFKKL